MPIPHVAQRLLAGDLAYLSYLAWQRWHRLDFSGVSVRDLGFTHEYAHEHANSGGPDLLRVLAQLRIPPNSLCVDLGSGKGGSTLTLAKVFSRVIGVELSAPLVEIAQRNVSRLGGDHRITFICDDAKEFQDYHTCEYVYLANSFPDPVVRAALRQIRASVSRTPRPMTIIYRYPGTPVTPFEGFTHQVIRVPLTHPFHIYSLAHAKK